MNINHINVDKGFVNPRKPPPPALRKYPLHKEADTTGVFWLPSDTDKKIPGQLFFIPGGGVQLVLNGSFHDGPERQVEYSAINGVLAKGTNCTIFGTQGFIDQYHSNNVAYVTILHSAFYVAGECFLDEKSFNFDLLDVQFSHIEKWFNPPYDLISDFESTELLMCFNPDKFEVEVEWNEKTFKISTFCSRTVPMGAGENETTINYSYRFHIKTNELYPAHIFLEVASVLRECLMFIIGTGVYTLDINAVANHTDIPTRQKHYSIFTGVKVPSYITTSNSFYKTNYDNFKDHLGKFIEVWFTKRTTLNVVINTYKDVLVNDSSSEEAVFIKILQTLEHFHGIIFDTNKYCSKREWKEFVQWFETNTATPDVNTVTEHINIAKLTQLRDIIVKRITGFNSLSLRSRLEDLFNNVNSGCLWSAIDNPNDPRKYIADAICDIENTRHYYTHYRESLEDKILTGIELERNTALLWGVINYHLGILLGLPEKLVDEMTFQSTRAMFLVGKKAKL